MILFNKEIFPRTHYCQLFDNDIELVTNPYINIQIKIKGCNANCLFCESKESGIFDENKFIEKYRLLANEIRIQKINMTGGEPTLNIDRLKRIIKEIKKINDPIIVINTNGYNLEKLFEDNINDMVDIIQVSRHHYIDEINNKILGFKSVSKDIIKSLTPNIRRRSLSLSCNLIKGYIDSPNEVYKYLEEASNIGIKWVGFVTLIPLNDYCKENQIKFSDFNFKDDRLILTKHFKDGNVCQCYNYFYVPEDLSEPVKVYNKQTENTPSKFIIFDGENFTIGFGGEILI